jgi:hypothetical protein
MWDYGPALYNLRNCVTSMHFGEVQTLNMYQYSETNVMHFLPNLLTINPNTCFRHYFLILRRRRNSILVQPIVITRTQYTKCRFCSSS